MNRLLGLVAAALLTAGAYAQTRTIEATASIAPAAPVSGENRLEVIFTEAGEPVAGLKLTASVGMTNMDMGTAHPPVVEVRPGRYVVRPMLLMSGPWRVSLASEEPKFSVHFDMTAGSKQPWRPAKQTLIIKGPPEVKPPNPEPPKVEPVKPTPTKGPEPMPGHAQGAMTHTAASLPQLKEESSYTWSDAMDVDTRTGFGKLYPMVRMMMLMMVGGSGMEGMKMAPMEMTFGPSNFVEGEPDSTVGPLKITATLPKPGVGDNMITVTIRSPEGKAIEKARVTASVAMTGMDMGTSHPAVAEVGHGQYTLKANFSMAGPWRLVLTVSTPGPVSTYPFDFVVRSKE